MDRIFFCPRYLIKVESYCEFSQGQLTKVNTWEKHKITYIFKSHHTSSTKMYEMYSSQLEMCYFKTIYSMNEHVLFEM